MRTRNIDFQVTVNGQQQPSVLLPVNMRLLDYLHEELGLTGTKLGCGIGECRACTVAIQHKPNGHWWPYQSCSTSLKVCNGWHIKTVEGLGNVNQLHPLQEAFVNNYAFQCGYSTPGFLMAGYCFLEQIKKAPIPIADIKAAATVAIGQNVCRCTGYFRYYQSLCDVAFEQLSRKVIETQPIISPKSPSQNKSEGNDTSVLRRFSDPYLELVRLLHEAAEVEHALMLQYLYAAFSIKIPEFYTLVGAGHRIPGQPLNLLGVAIEEMLHFDIINRLLVALGANPKLDHQDFPYEPDIYPFELSLEPLDRASLARYVYVEASEDSLQPDPTNPKQVEFLKLLDRYLPANISLNRVGSLYATILAVIDELVHQDNQIIPNSSQWKQELSYVKEEGEFEHFGLFKSIFLGEHPAFVNHENIWEFAENNSTHALVYDVASNPTAFEGHANTIADDEARGIAWLGNLHYWVTLLLLSISYRAENCLHHAARRHMAVSLRSLGTWLAQQYKVGLPFDKLTISYTPGTSKRQDVLFLNRFINELKSQETAYAAVLPDDYDFSVVDQTARDLDLFSLDL